MLKAARHLAHAVHMHPRLMGERAVADERLLGVGAHIGLFINKLRKRAELLEVVRLRQAGVPHLQHQIRNDGTQITVANPFADPVDRPLHMHRADVHSGQRVGHAQLAVVMRMDADRRLKRLDHRGGDFRHFVRQRATVGFAKDKTVGPSVRRGFERGHRVFRAVLVAVEKMLGVVNHLFAVCLQKPDTVSDHRQIFFGGRLKHFGYVQKPALAEDRANGRVGLQQRGEAFVLFRLNVRTAGRTERGDFGVFEGFLLNQAEKLHVFGIGRGEPAFDVGEAELVETFGNLHFGDGGKGNSLRLCAVAQCRVINGYLFSTHGFPRWNRRQERYTTPPQI